jgi:hypothetical protein
VVSRWRQIAAVGLLVGRAAHAQAPASVPPDSVYAPVARFAGDTAEARVLQPWVALELRGAREPPLPAAGTVRAAAAYRVTTLSGWGGGARLLRLERRGGAWVLVRKATEPAGRGRERAHARRVLRADSLPVPARAAERVVAVIRAAGYWRPVPATACGLGFDGHEVLLEAREAAGYAAALCFVPEVTGTPGIRRTIRAFGELERATFGADSSRAP